MRLTDLLQNKNGNGLSVVRYRSLKKRYPFVFKYSDQGGIDFRGKPKNRAEAIIWIRNQRLLKGFEEKNGIGEPSKQMILIEKGSHFISIEHHLMEEFSIDPDEI